MLDPVMNNPWVRAIGVLVALVGLAILAYLLSPVLVPLFLAFLVAYALDPVVDLLERRRLSRTRSIAVLAGIGLVIAFSIPIFVVSSLYHDADQLGTKAEARIDVSDEGEGSKPSFIYRMIPEERLRALVESMDWVPSDAPEDFDPLAVILVQISENVKSSLTGFLSANGQELASVGKKAGIGVASALGAIAGWLVGAILFLANFALFAFVAVYLLRDYDDIIEASKELVPPKYRSKLFDIMGKINSNLRGFIRGQMMVCAFLGAMYAIGLSVAGVPLAILLALFGAVASFIPYLGLALTIIPAVLLCLVAHDGITWHLFVVLGTFGGAQFLEGSVITPKFVGEQVGLGPVWVILAVLVFGNALGFLGLLLAVPIAATLKVLIIEGIEYYRHSPVFANDDGPEEAAQGES